MESQSHTYIAMDLKSFMPPWSALTEGWIL